MKRTLLGCLGLLLAAILPARADDTDSLCYESASLALADGGVPIQYARSREIDISHLALEVTPDFRKRTVSGEAVWTFKPAVKALEELRLDAIDLDIKTVESTAKLSAWHNTGTELVLTFDKPVEPGREVKVTIRYSAQPTLGLYFRTADMGYKAGDDLCFSQGEEIEHRHWYPCYDEPNAKFTSEVTCHVPDGMTVLSNGRLVSDEKDLATGLRVVHWSQEKPHSNYLIALAAGNFKAVEGKHGSVPLAFYVPNSDIDQAQSSFEDTDDIMSFFEKEIGVKFPWAKYYQVCVPDFVAGGMENTTLTILNTSTLFTSATEDTHNSQSLVSHELAHQWFGDLVTCKDWSHTWLNEGFATYYQVLYDGYKNGHDSLNYSLYQNARRVLATTGTNDIYGIVNHRYAEPGEQFGYRSYQKGGWILHMLRCQLGEDLYRRCIKTYLERHQYGNVSTEDLRAVIEELSGRDWDKFFDEWVFHGHYPELTVNYSWDDRAKAARFTVAQTQAVNDNVFLFEFPLKIACVGKSGRVEKTFQVKSRDEEFFLPLPEAPDIARVDPDYELLARIDVRGLSRPMLTAQLNDKSDMMGRLLAIDQLQSRSDHETIVQLKQLLNGDSFWAVRNAAAGALRVIHNDESLAALIDSTSQREARVRREVQADIASFYDADAFKASRIAAEREKNPDVLAVAIHGLANHTTPEIHDQLLSLLKRPSYRNSIADAVIAAMRAQADPTYLTPIMETLKKGETDFLARSFASDLDAVAYLAKRQDNKDAAREFLTGYLNDQREAIKIGAIRALGTLEDPKSIPALTTFSAALAQTPIRTTADQALETIRAARQPVDTMREMREQVLDLQRQLRDLKKDVDNLHKVTSTTPNAPSVSTNASNTGGRGARSARSGRGGN